MALENRAGCGHQPSYEDNGWGKNFLKYEIYLVTPQNTMVEEGATQHFFLLVLNNILQI